MKVEESAKKRFAETDSEEPGVPEDFSCIDPPQMPLVFDFLNTSNQDLKEMVLIHLQLCLHCRELAETVLKINRYLEPKSGHYLHPKISEIDTETEPVI
ncbi:MAG TPA: hypothetical protein VGB73_04530 [Pyrinomonadaceae bacterium]